MKKYFLKIFAIAAIFLFEGSSCKNDTVTFTITEVLVNPSTVDIKKGENQNFTVKVMGANNPAQTVSWSIVETNKNVATVIAPNGKLTVSASEELESLTVKATSAIDKTKSGTALVTIINDGIDIDPTNKTAFQYFKDEGIKLGWNMGNSFDAVNTWSTPGIPFSEETAWGNPKATQTLFNGVKAQGINIVRIPVTWIGHIGAEPDYKVDEAWLMRLAEVVNYAKNAGLKAIINIHHDDSNEFGWLLIKDAANNASANIQITAKFEKLWTQVAEYFKDYDEWLMFESMNEIHDGDWGWSDDFRNNPQKQFNVLNNWNQVFVNAVRATGGKNDTRYLIVPSYVSNYDQLLSERFILPTDKFSGKLIVTFHYYDPFEFAHNASTPNWGNQQEKSEIDNLFARFKARFTDKNILVIIGEMGPRNHATETGKQNRLVYISYVYHKARETGLLPIYWDDGGNFGMMNRNTGQPKDAHSAAAFEAMVKATQ